MMPALLPPDSQEQLNQTPGCKTCGGSVEYAGWFNESLCQGCMELESLCPCLDRPALEPVCLPTTLLVPASFYLNRLRRLTRLVCDLATELNEEGHRLLQHAIFSTYRDIEELGDVKALKEARKLVDGQ